MQMQQQRTDADATEIEAASTTKEQAAEMEAAAAATRRVSREQTIYIYNLLLYGI